MFNFFGDGGGFGGHGHGGDSDDEPVDTESLYKTLGVSKTATSAEIKKAYRRKAMSEHPDKGGDVEKFKELTKANEILGNEEKRAKYDKYGEKGLEQGGGGGGGDAGDIFSQFFGGGGRGGPRGPRKGKDVPFRLQVTLGELYNGASKKLRLSKNMICAKCEGKGGKNVSKCGSCRGQGVKVMLRQIGPGMVQQMQVQCDACDGQGEIIKAGDKCGACNGQKVNKVKKTLEVFIEKGMTKDSKITFRNESDQAPGIVPGDVIVMLEEMPHPVFRREGPHLFIKKRISLLEALTGYEFPVTHLDGRILLIKPSSPSVVHPGSVKCVRDEGMPKSGNQFSRGNLYIQFEIIMPTSADIARGSVARTLKATLPAPEQKSSMDDEDIEECELEEVDLDTERRRWADEKRQARQGDSDDEEGGGAQQCRTQ